MIDVFNINDGSLNNQVFYYAGEFKWQTWYKPQNCKFVNFYLIGGGAGGQGGLTGTTINRTGGAGGGSAAISYYTIPAFALPDILYVLVASGGTGGLSPGGRGGQGTLSYVSTQPDSSLSRYNILMKSGSANAGASTSATAGAAITASDAILSEIGFISAYAGQTGGAGGITSGAAPNITPVGIPTTPGAGGAGVTSGGVLGTSGSILPILDFPRISGGTSASGAGATNGQNGILTRENFVGPNFKHPMFFTGGAGGGSSHTSIGGDGGNGAYGCGGGGGGAGGAAGAGDGGNGGYGLVIITAS